MRRRLLPEKQVYTCCSRWKSFEQRMREAELVDAQARTYEGKEDALVAVILLLIDKDVSGYGHRKLFFTPCSILSGFSAFQVRQFYPGSGP